MSENCFGVSLLWLFTGNTELPLSVTKPFLANTLPLIEAPIFCVMAVIAKIFPWKSPLIVAELPTCQNIFDDTAPPVRTTPLLAPVVNVDAA